MEEHGDIECTGEYKDDPVVYDEEDGYKEKIVFI